MLSHTGSLWQYLGSFVGYTLLAVGLIYGAYWFLRKQPNNWFTSTAFRKTTDKNTLSIEANLALEPRKNLYIIQAGTERFLISTTLEKIQCLSKLTDESELPVPVAEPVMRENRIEQPQETELPWFTQDRPNITRNSTSKPSFGARLAQSVQWLIETRK